LQTREKPNFARWDAVRLEREVTLRRSADINAFQLPLQRFKIRDLPLDLSELPILIVNLVIVSPVRGNSSHIQSPYFQPEANPFPLPVHTLSAKFRGADKLGTDLSHRSD